MIKEIKKRSDIQALRGLAVLSVVLFHADEKQFPGGYLGVDIFFVISGFVVTPLILRIFTKDNTRDRLSTRLRYFFVRRFYRLAPALASTLSISAILIFLIGSPDDHQRFALQGISSLLLIGNLGAYKYSGNYFSPNPNPLVHLWSLSVEEQIYIVLPCILLIFCRNRRIAQKKVVGIFALISVISFILFLLPAILDPIYSKIGIQTPSQFHFYSMPERAWQFTIGGLIYFFLDKYSLNKKILKAANLLCIFGLFLVVLGGITFRTKNSSILISLIVVVIICFRSFDVLPNFLSKGFEWLGDRSYSIYLVHMPLMYLVRNSSAANIGDNGGHLFQSVIAVLASVVLGSLSYSKIENRFRSGWGRNSSGLLSSMWTILPTLAVPFFILVVINLCAINQYWGLDTNEKRPPYAGYLDPNCERDTSHGPPCVYNPNLSRKIMLIGDSHAGMISEAFINASIQTGASAIIWTHSGCKLQITAAQNSQDHCLSINALIEYFVKHKPDAILVSESLREDYRLKPLAEAILRIKEHVPAVAVLAYTPVFPDSGRFMKAMPLLMSPYHPPKEFKIREMNAEPFKASQKLELWTKHNNIGFVSLNSLFCNQSICNRWSTKSWLFRDTDHLSVVGAEMATPIIFNWMDSLG